MENSSNSSATVESTSQNQNEIEPGCGCNNITISVNPTTGGQFDLAVTKNDTIENLKKLISKKLKVPKERICLLHRERQLRDGTIQENQLVNGSRLTLLPSVETGLLAQRPEQSVMQALESLNDCQVNDFLSGKAPLNLTMRLGDHMMLIQLQLSTVTPNSSSQSSTSSSTTTSSSSSSSTTLTSSSNSSPLSGSKRVTLPNSKSQQTINKTTVYPSQTNQIKDPLASLSSIVESATAADHLNPAGTPSTNLSTSTTNARVNGSMSSNNSIPLPSTPQSSNTQPKTSTLPSSTSSSSSTTSTTSIPSSSSKSTTTPTLNSTSTSSATTSPSSSTSSLLEGCKCDSASTLTTTTKPTLDTRALAEASRNLTQTLKQLSSEVLTSKSDPVEDVSTSTKRRQGAIIESMHHHGKGVYSGTFSGTLNPALQDRFGRPKRDISTIIHILNDLLCATPQYRNCRGAASTTSTSSSTSNSNGSNSEKSSSNTQPAASVTTDSEGTTSSLSTSESLENQATRGKMERLRLIMEERREKRRAARSSPYARNSGGQTSGLHVNNANGLNHTQWSANAKSETQRTNPSPSSNTASDQPNLPMDTDLCSQPEVSPEPVVA